MSVPIVLAAGAVTADDLLRFWAALAALLVTARLLGLLAKRFGQPSVIGELSAGIVLGPTVLERLAPDVAAWLFGGDATSIMLAAVAWLGVVMLLALTGFETDLGMLRRLGRAAGWTSVTSLVIPFVAGLGLALALPQAFRGEVGGVSFVLFMGVALAISALPVVAKVLREMGVIGGPVGQVTLAAGMVNDLVGWVLLGLVAGLAGSGTVDLTALGITVAGTAVFIGLAMTVGQRGIDRLLRLTVQRDAASSTTVGVAVGVVLVAGTVTQALGVEAVLGAFVAGILLARSPLGGKRVEHQMSAVTDGFLAPVFFATAGLQVDLFAVVSPDVLGWTVAVVAVATIGKVLGGFLGGRIGGLSTGESLSVGVGLNARGALEIVVATIGLNLGVLSEVAYSVIVVMAVLTSMSAPPALAWLGKRYVTAGVAPARAASPLLDARSALLPTRGGDSSIRAGMLLDQILPVDTQLTALTVHPPELPAAAGRQAAREVGEHIHRRMAWRDRVASGAAAAILDEARLGYDLIAVGASAEDGDAVVSPVLAELLMAATAPILIVRTAEGMSPTAPVERIIATVDGTPACDAARDIAATLAAANRVPLDLVHVLPLAEMTSATDVPISSLRRAVDRVEVIGRAASERAAGFGVAPAFVVRSGHDVARVVAEEIAESRADVVVIGTQVRSAGGELVLGRTVEDLLLHCKATVMVLAIPPSARGMVT